MFVNWSHDSKVAGFMLGGGPHLDPSDSLATIEEWSRRYESKDFYLWAVVLKGSGDLIGAISGTITDPTEAASAGGLGEGPVAELAFSIGKNWWRQGFTHEFLKVIIKFFFEEVKVNRIFVRYGVNRAISGETVMKQCGIKYSSTVHKAQSAHGEEVIEYSIHASDYFATVNPPANNKRRQAKRRLFHSA
jgi:ribosomal-protein-alanine N-acetyltransferase